MAIIASAFPTAEAKRAFFTAGMCSASAATTKPAIPERTINVLISDEELAARRAEEESRGKLAFTPHKRNRVVSKALQAYASMVTSADRGGVRE